MVSFEGKNMAKRKIKRLATRGFKHRKVPSHPPGCKGFLHPLKSNPETYLVCDGCRWQIPKLVAVKYGYKEEE